MKHQIIIPILIIMLFSLVSAKVDCWELQKSNDLCYYMSLNECNPPYYSEYLDCKADLNRVDTRNYLQKFMENNEIDINNKFINGLYTLDNAMLTFALFIFIFFIWVIYNLRG